MTALIDEQNKTNLRHLVLQLRSAFGVIPFVGAGLSAGLKFPQWARAISDMAASADRKARETVAALLKQEKFQEAADVTADALGEEVFQMAVAEKFDDYRLTKADLSRGPFAFLPFLSNGPVITTNFDRVLERVYEQARKPFSEKVYGANPDEVVPALQQNRQILWKIHGDWKDRRTRVLTKKEYDESYKDLERLLWMALTNRPVFFLGCSLEKDRIVKILDEIQSSHKGVVHFAVVQAPPQKRKFDDCARKMRKLGIRPIWYPEKKHECIGNLMAELLENVSSVPINLKRPAQKLPRKSSDKLHESARRLLNLEIKKLRERSKDENSAALDQNKPPYTPMLDRMARGNIAFFLGAGACMGRLPLGHAFYQHFIDKFGASSDELPPSRLAQHFADQYGRDTLYTQIGNIINQAKPQPTAIHWFVATLQQRLREKGYHPKPLMILTTNNDDWMERALQSAGERYHLFSYRREKPHRGCFLHCDPDGEVRAIDRPYTFRRLHEDCTIVIKYHGGIHAGLSLPPSYVFTHRDFVDLAGRVPDVIPQVLLNRLQQTSLLFIGHGLNDDSVESLMRHLNSSRCNSRSWAIQHLRHPAHQAYWAEINVDIIYMLQEKFIIELDRELEQWPTAPLT